MIQLGQHAPPTHVIAHLSDTHFLGGGRPLYGAVDTDSHLARALHQLERSGVRPEAIVITGDLADVAEPDAYERLRNLVDPVAERLGAEVVWVMGNHDERPPFAAAFFGGETTDPLDRVYRFGGLRLIALDTSVPGYHHGELTAAQLDWLREELAAPSPDGTILTLHHPPLPSPVEIMAILELQDQHLLADVIRGTDVRAILAGHLHYSTTGLFAGVPVSVASATCYTIDNSGPAGSLTGVDGGQAFNLVHVFDDQVVHTIVPLSEAPQVAGFSGVVLEALAAMSPEERREAFSNKASTFNLADAEAAAGAARDEAPSAEG